MNADTLVDPCRTSRNNRRHLRLPIELRSQIGNSLFGTRTVTLTDISTRGFCAATPFLWVPGTHLVLSIPKLSPMLVTVKWSTNAAAGFAFEKALHPSVVDHVVLTARTLAAGAGDQQ